MREILMGFSVFVDGVGFIGEAKQVTLPKLTAKTEDYLGQGMSTPAEVYLGTEKLEGKITFNGVKRQAFTLFGISPGRIIPFTCHGAVAAHDGAKLALTVHMRGFVKEVDEGDWEQERLTETSIAFAVHYYKRLENNEKVLEIDAFSGVHGVGGVDQNAWMRDALRF